MGKFPFGKLWLSPMESVSDLGFRTLCYQYGASLTFTEMIPALALIQKNKASLSLIDTYTPSVKTGLQLLVSKPEVLHKALKTIREGIETRGGVFSNILVIDLNFGCPSPDIINSGNGPAMLKRTAKMKELLTILKKESPLPCGIKIRLGLNDKEKQQKVYLRVIDIANDVGLNYVTIHAKTAADKSTAPLDWKALQEIIAKARIPIVGNGLVVDGPSAKRMLDMGCSAVMVARAAVGNPWIFEEIDTYLKTGSQPHRERTIKEYQDAWDKYALIAHKYGTKQKFYDYHRRIFELRMRGDTSYHSPSKILSWV